MFSPENTPKTPQRIELHPEHLMEDMEKLSVLEGKINRLYLRLSTKPDPHAVGDHPENFTAVTDSNLPETLDEWGRLKREYETAKDMWGSSKTLLEPLRVKPGSDTVNEMAIKIEEFFTTLKHLADVVPKINAWQAAHTNKTDQEITPDIATTTEQKAA